ncbi:unannotated protein [freshwater metagenome]|uniref:Unannotated protein n=1 Tax=freshwater metagenome TaxID=449393 RepID=A0A6J7QTF5_9ZZZZ
MSYSTHLSADAASQTMASGATPTEASRPGISASVAEAILVNELYALEPALGQLPVN